MSVTLATGRKVTGISVNLDCLCCFLNNYLSAEKDLRLATSGNGSGPQVETKTCFHLLLAPSQP